MKITTAMGALILVTVLSIILYNFIGLADKNEGTIEMILYVYTGNIVLWTSISFLFIKILFFNSKSSYP